MPEHTQPTESEMHKEFRKREGRQGYINWRMADLPTLYQNLMPYSYDMKALWKAEKTIRMQYAVDQEAAKSPWRRLGPVCNVLDGANMTSIELLTFGMEVAIPIGMEDQPKPGSVFDRKSKSRKQLESAIENGRLTPGEAEYALAISADIDAINDKQSPSTPPADSTATDAESICGAALKALADAEATITATFTLQAMAMLDEAQKNLQLVHDAATEEMFLQWEG